MFSDKARFETAFSISGSDIQIYNSILKNFVVLFFFFLVMHEKIHPGLIATKGKQSRVCICLSSQAISSGGLI